jgi:hypothetical protein
VQGHRDLAPAGIGIAAFEHRARQLLDEQRHATGAFDHRLDGVIR